MSDYIHPMDRRSDDWMSAAEESRQELNEHLERTSTGGLTLRPGWFLRAGTSRAPRGSYALEYGFQTTTATRHLVAVIHPSDLGKISELYPEAFEVAAMRET